MKFEIIRNTDEETVNASLKIGAGSGDLHLYIAGHLIAYISPHRGTLTLVDQEESNQRELEEIGIKMVDRKIKMD